MPTAQQGMNITNTAQIAAGVVENADLATDAVSKIKVADAAIASTEIENDSIMNEDINSAAAINLDKTVNSTTRLALTNGTQTIDGIKTFTSFPITPSSAPTTDYQTANKKYVDEATIGASRASAYLPTAGQSIASGSDTKITLSAEEFDNLGEFDAVTNYRFTASTAGIYLVSFNLYWQTTTLGKEYWAKIKKNNTAIAGELIRSAVASADLQVSGVRLISLAVNDYIELFALHDTGSNVTVLHGTDKTVLGVQRVA